MSKYLFFLPILSIFLLHSCTQDDGPLPSEKLNQSPSSFNAQVVGVERKSATISWSESMGPEGVNVTYSVYKNYEETPLATGLTNRTFTFSDLPINTSFSAVIKATDGDGNSKVSNALNIQVLPSSPPSLTNIVVTNVFQIFPTVKIGNQIAWNLNPSVDPDGGAILYDLVMIEEKTGFQHNLLSNSVETSFFINSVDMPASGKFNLRLTSKDEDGMTSLATGKFLFICNNPFLCPLAYKPYCKPGGDPDCKEPEFVDPDLVPDCESFLCSD